MSGKRLRKYESRRLGIVAEQRMSCLREGVARSRMDDVRGENDLSKRESASSTTKCVTRERTFGSDSVMLARRWGVLISMSMPLGEKSRLRTTIPVYAD